jgi:hypothetical protein
MKDKTNSMFQTGQTGIDVLHFPSLGFIWLRFVSDLVLRISDFVSEMLWRGKICRSSFVK